jgi:hypothetical protein
LHKKRGKEKPVLAFGNFNIFAFTQNQIKYEAIKTRSRSRLCRQALDIHGPRFRHHNVRFLPSLGADLAGLEPDLENGINVPAHLHLGWLGLWGYDEVVLSRPLEEGGMKMRQPEPLARRFLILTNFVFSTKILSV